MCLLLSKHTCCTVYLHNSVWQHSIETIRFIFLLSNFSSLSTIYTNNHPLRIMCNIVSWMLVIVWKKNTFIVFCDVDFPWAHRTLNDAYGVPNKNEQSYFLLLFNPTVLTRNNQLITTIWSFGKPRQPCNFKTVEWHRPNCSTQASQQALKYGGLLLQKSGWKTPTSKMNPMTHYTTYHAKLKQQSCSFSTMHINGVY